MPPLFADMQARLLDWYAKNMRVLPWRQTRDPYHVLVSEIMLQQTQVSRAVPKYEAFLDRFPTPDALANAPAADVIRAWQGLGYNRRALLLQRAVRHAAENGGFPKTPGALDALPGIGPYTAAAVASLAFGQPVAVVDTNVRRVLQRLFGWPEPVEDMIGLQAQQLLAGDSRRWNNALMELGALVCTAAPKCAACPLQTHCAYEKLPAGQQAQFTYAVAKQPLFRGSDRYFRGRILDALRKQGSLEFGELERLVRGLGSPRKPVAELVAAMEKDGLVKQAGRRVSLP